MQFDEETLADGNYSTTLSVVTVEPAGLSDSHTDKIRLLLVRAAAPLAGTAGPPMAACRACLEGQRPPGGLWNLDASPAGAAHCALMHFAGRGLQFRCCCCCCCCYCCCLQCCLLLQNFGEHGRELISSEIALRLLRLLCDEAQRAPLLEAYGLSPAHVQQLLQRAVFKVGASAG